ETDSGGPFRPAGEAPFPTTPGALQTTFGPAFVTKLNAAGSALVYSTYFGSSVRAMAVDTDRNAYVTGIAATGFPTTPGAFQCTQCGSGDAFVTKLNATGSDLVYSTLLGGGDFDIGVAIA